MSLPPFFLLILALLPFGGAALLATLSPRWRRGCAWVAGAVTLAGLAIVLMAASDVFDGEILRWRVDWVPALGLAFGLRMDGLAWLFTLLITGIGALIVLYAAYYLHHDDPARRFFLYLLLFMGAMLGIVLADNLILLVVFWELTSLSSFLLIGYWSGRPDAREGARMALTITGGGGLAMLAGVLLLGHIVGSYDLDRVLAAGPVIVADPLYPLALVLILLGCFTKSAQFPFHFWLPHAMAAPTPVSAYLHSATMVKAGVFMLARLHPALAGSELWFWLVSGTGLATLLLGAYIAIFKHDLKGLLAYSTISHLGLITLLFGLDTPLAVVAGVFHIINHATFKASLFMAAGIIDHETGSRDMRRLNGLWKYMPRTAVLGIVAASAMAGVPLANGFLSKEMFFAEAVAQDGHELMQIALPLLATIAGILSVAYSARFVHDVFFNGEPKDLPKTPHEPPMFMRVPVEILVLLCLAVGLLPGLVVGPTLAVAAQAALHGGPLGALPEYKLAIWHGFNLPLLMSAIALVAGVLLYVGLQRFIDLHTVVRLPLWIEKGGRDFFMNGQKRVVATAQAATQALQSGRLQRYLTLLVLLTLAAGAWPFLRGIPLTTDATALSPAPLPFIAVALIGMAAAIGTVAAHRQRLLALLLLGAVGLVVSLIFVVLSAPDLALTQLLVEVVTIILMMLALNWLPRQGEPEGLPLLRNARKLRDAALAGAAGLGTAALCYLVLMRPFDSIAPYFLETAVPEGGGANVVNVILVDYRGYDTLGEITVLGIAGLLIHALLAGFLPARSGAAAAQAAQGDGLTARHPLLLMIVSRLLLPFVVLVSIYLFLRGHNQPGGGFIAGLVLSIGLILLFVANGRHWVEERMRSDFRGWIAWGLLIAGLSGIGSWFLGSPFLTSTYDYPDIWPFGPIPLASASVFDLGVYLTVVGATMVALIAIGRLSGVRSGTQRTTPSRAPAKPANRSAAGKAARRRER